MAKSFLKADEATQKFSLAGGLLCGVGAFALGAGAAVAAVTGLVVTMGIFKLIAPKEEA